MSQIRDNKDDNMSSTDIDLSDLIIDFGEINYGNNLDISTITFTGGSAPTNGPYQTYDKNLWIDESFIFTDEKKEFINIMPPMDTIKEMCDLYPGFKKAFENFKDFYDLVKGDYCARKNSDE